MGGGAGFKPGPKLSDQVETKRVSVRPVSNFPADEVAFLKRQKHAIDSMVASRAVQKLGLEPRRSHVVDDQPSARHEARHHLLVNLGVGLSGSAIGEAERDIVETAPRVLGGG